MREILFRGKHAHMFSSNEPLSGMWCYGYLVDKNYINDKTVYDDGEYLGEMLVDPETVGQYTGLHDKNGKEIFEGDICEFRSFNCRRVGVVIFNDEKCRFELLQSGDADWSLEIHEVFDLKVISNIHDNPELMEV